MQHHGSLSVRVAVAVLVAVAGALALCAAAPAALGATVYVDDSFSADDPAAREWTALQEGLSDAAPGDTVYVYDGTYAEFVVLLNGSVTVEGESRTGVIVDKAGVTAGTVFAVNASGALLRNLTVKGGATGIAIASGADNGTLENVTVTGSDSFCLRLASVSAWNVSDTSLSQCNGVGLSLISASSSSFFRVNSTSNAWNFYLTGSGNNTFYNLTTAGIKSGGSGNIYLSNSPHNRFIGGTWSSALPYSSVALGTAPYTGNHNTTVQNVTCIRWSSCLELWNGTSGFYGSGLRVADNTYGLYGSYSGGITIESSVFTANFYYHLYASASFSTPFDRLVVRNSTFNGTTAYYAMLLSHVRFGTFENNSFSGADESLHFVFSNNSLVQDNTFVASTSCAIFGSYTDYLGLYRNTFQGGGCAIRWTYSSYWLLRNNSVPNMTNAFQHTVGGVPLPSAYIHDMDTSNTLNGRPVLYVVNATGGTYSGNYSWIALANSNGISVTSSGNVTRDEWGVFAFNLNASTLYNLNLSGNQWGLALFYSFDNTIRDTAAAQNTQGGMYFSASGRNLVLRPLLVPASASSGIGVHFDDATHNSTVEAGICGAFSTCFWFDAASNDLAVVNATVTGAYTGVEAYGENRLRVEGSSFSSVSYRAIVASGASFLAARGVQLLNNTINGTMDGVYLAYATGALVSGNRITNATNAAIDLSFVDNTTLRGNTLRYVTYAVRLTSSATNVMQGNVLSNLTHAGYTASTSSSNMWYQNSFFVGAGSVYDAGTGSAYDDGYTHGGNYWSNGTHEDQYGGPNQNQDGGDGIQDTWQGVVGALVDRYPFVGTLPPTVTLVSPAQGSLIGAGVLVQLNVSLLFTTVQVSLNNASSFNLSSPYAINLTGASDGPLHVRIWANRSTAFLFQTVFLFVLDATAPNVTLVAPTLPGVFVAGTSLNFTVSDANLAANVTWSNGSANGTLTSPWRVSTAGWSDGDYTVTVVAWDLAGNQRVAAFAVTVDSTAPSLTLTAPAVDAIFRAGTLLWFNVSDAHLLSVTWDNGGANGSLSAPFSINTTGWVDGSYNVSVVARDEAGNTFWGVYHFVLDSTPPTIVPWWAFNGSIFDSGTSLQFVITDAHLSSVQGDNGTGPVPLAPPTYDIPLPGWADGNYTVTVTATDAANNSRVAVYFFTLDSTLPTLVLRSPADGSFVPSGTLLDFDVIEANLLSVTMDAGPGPTSFASPYDISTVGLPDGRYTFAMTATDLAGNLARRNFVVTIDSTDPSLLLVAPANTSIIPVGTIIQLNASDTNLATVEYKWGLSGTFVPLPAPYNVSTAALPDGPIAIFVRAVDRAQHSVELWFGFTFDSVAPVITLVSPTNGSSVRAGVTLDFEVAEPHLELARWERWINDFPVDFQGLPSPFDIDTAGWEERAWMACVSAFDRAGLSSMVCINVTIDDTPPVITVVAVGAGLPDPRYATEYPAYIFLGGFLPGVYFQINVSEPTPFPPVYWNPGARWDEALDASGQIHPRWGNGSWGMDVRAYDAAGNRANRSWTYIQDGTPPLITIVSPANGSSVRAGVTLDFEVAEPHLELALWERSQNGFPVSFEGLPPPFDIDTTGWGEITWIVCVSAFDLAGLRSMVCVNVTIDMTPPVMSVVAIGPGIRNPNFGATNPRDEFLGGFLPGVLFRVTVSEPLLFGGVYWNPVARWYEALNVSGEIVPRWGNGSHWMEVHGSDAAGNLGNLSWSYVQDGTAPRIAWFMTYHSDTMQSGVDLTFAVSDDHLDRVTYWRVPSPTGLDPRPLGPPYVLPTAGWGEGTSEVCLQAYDRSGNRGEMCFNQTIDDTAPVMWNAPDYVQSRAPFPSQAEFAVPVGWSRALYIEDANSVFVVMNNGSGWRALGGPSPYWVNTTGWAPGNYTVVVEARDSAANLARIEFTVHLEAPPASAPGMPTEALLAILLAAGAAAGAALFLRSRGRP